jgi:predicted phage-related endonuclease
VVEEVCARENIALDRVVYEPDAQHHPEIEWMFCHPDALVPEKGILIEAKTGHLAWASAWGEAESDEIPDGVLIQVQHNLACMAHPGYRLALVPILLGGQRFRVYRVAPDREIQDWIINEDDSFWKHVLVREAPPVRTPEEARALYRNAIDKPIEASEEIYAAYQSLREAEASEEPIEAQIKAAKAKLMAYMGAHDTLTYRGRELATWRQTKEGFVFDEDRFAKENEALYKSYREPKPGVRRFLPNRKQQG